jgi:hypothetical protein
MRRVGILTVIILLTSHWFVSQASSRTLINDHLSLIHTEIEFTPTPMQGGPAGTYIITATFENLSLDGSISPAAFTALTFIVTKLTGGNLLLNADKGTGGVGSSLTAPFTGEYSDRLLSPGERFTVDFIIGLASVEPFEFFMDVLGASGDLQTLLLENIATVVQINSCQDCEGVTQQNLAFIFQSISTNNIYTYIPDLIKSNKKFMENIPNKGSNLAELLMNLNKSQKFLMWCFSVSENGDLQALSLENIATVVQNNSCQDCEGVTQQNLAFIFQNISTNDVFMYTSDLIKYNQEFIEKISNIASIIQENICIECASVNQQNLTTIFQEIDIDNFLINPDTYQTYLNISQNEIVNIANVSQINECIICQNVNQINSVFILQYIGSEDLFIPTSGFTAQDSLFTDLVNIATMIYRRTSESNLQYVEGTYGKFERYFVPVRPGVHSPK